MLNAAFFILFGMLSQVVYRSAITPIFWLATSVLSLMMTITVENWNYISFSAAVFIFMMVWVEVQSASDVLRAVLTTILSTLLFLCADALAPKFSFITGLEAWFSYILLCFICLNASILFAALVRDQVSTLPFSVIGILTIPINLITDYHIS
jgi:hypothetical protein